MFNMIRWGIIGTGDVAERKGGPALYRAERSTLVAITSRSPARAKRFAARHGNPRVHDSVESLLADGEVDAVYIATHPDSHADLTELAANAGKHVLCEKPMALSMDQANRMIEVCQEHNVALSVAYYRREFPAVKKMKALVQAGAIGRPLSIGAQTYSAFTSPEANPWRLDEQRSGGGFLMDVGSHRFDLFGHFFGRPHEVLGIARSQSLPTSVEDAAAVSLGFQDGVLGTACFHWNTPVPCDTLTIVGSEGVLSIAGLSDRGELTLETKAGKELWSLPAAAPVHQGLVDRIVEHVLDGGPNPCSGEDGAIATEMISRLYQ